MDELVEEQRDLVNQSILEASNRLTHDHELSCSTKEELKRKIKIDYYNELIKLFIEKQKNANNIISKQIKIYINNKDKIINNRLQRMLMKKNKILKRSEADWNLIEEQYRNEELEHIKILLSFKPSNDVIYIKRACYNDIRLIRNYIRTIIFNGDNFRDDNIISKYRNLEFKLNTNENYVVIETIEYDNDIYGYLVNKHNYFEQPIIKIINNKTFSIDIIRDSSLREILLQKFYEKIK